ncbi:MAG: FHA domain-containing protein [Pseudomonadota bacterium]
MKGLLRILSGEGEKGVVDLETGTYTIGRDESAEIKIDSRQVSRKHAQVIVEQDQVRLVDCGSANGTLVNGKAITALTIRDGDRIQVGDVVFEYHSKRVRSNPPPSQGEKDVYTVRRSSRGARIVPPPGKQRMSSLPLRPLLSLLFAVGMGGVTLLVGMSFRSSIEARLTRESLHLGSALVRYLAEKNKEELRVGNELLLDAETVLKERGVREAYIINKKGRVLAPSAKLGQLDNDLYTGEALNQTGDQVRLPSPPLADGTRIFVHPIQVYNDKQGMYQTVGVAKIVFSPRDAVAGVSDLDRVILVVTMAAAAVGALLAWLLAAWLTRPLARLAESIHQRRLGQPVRLPGTPFREWAHLFDAIERILEEKNR